MSDCDNCIMNFREDCSGIDCVQIRIAMNNHDKQIRDEVIEGYKWISVKDKMPSDCGEDWVLVLPYDGDYRCIPTVAEYRKGHWWGHTLCTEDDCIDGEDSPFEIKYWKPIYDEFQMEYLEQMKGEQNDTH